MMPTCFNVLVYQMDSAQKVTTAAETSLLGTSPYLEDEQNFDASLMGVTGVVDPAIPSITQMDVKANEASEFTDLSSTSDNIIKTENIFDKKDDPNILLPLSMEPNAEMIQRENYPSEPQELDNSLLDAIEIRDAFIFFPISEPIVLNERLGQGIL